jgi:hypothetical protein
MSVTQDDVLASDLCSNLQSSQTGTVDLAVADLATPIPMNTYASDRRDEQCTQPAYDPAAAPSLPDEEKVYQCTSFVPADFDVNGC